MLCLQFAEFCGCLPWHPTDGTVTAAQHWLAALQGMELLQQLNIDWQHYKVWDCYSSSTLTGNITRYETVTAAQHWLAPLQGLRVLQQLNIDWQHYKVWDCYSSSTLTGNITRCETVTAAQHWLATLQGKRLLQQLNIDWQHYKVWNCYSSSTLTGSITRYETVKAAQHWLAALQGPQCCRSLNIIYLFVLFAGLMLWAFFKVFTYMCQMILQILWVFFMWLPWLFVFIYTKTHTFHYSLGTWYCSQRTTSKHWYTSSLMVSSFHLKNLVSNLLILFFMNVSAS